MSREQLSVPELLLSLDSSERQEAELVRAAVNQQLDSDRGGAVLHSLVEYYLDSSSRQALLVLSSVKERHHKPLLDKLNDCLGRAGSRAAVLSLLGHLVHNQPPWVHLLGRTPLLPSLLRCLKTDGDMVVLVTGVLVLVTLLPMIPQSGKQHIYDFFDVFGRLAAWSFRNPGVVPAVQLLHLQAAVYSLFHRLYGMFPCNFMSYLRLHYSMKENLDTFQEVVKPMLQHVRVHPELVSGTQDQELDPSRWRSFEVHDIILECSRVSLDPLESSCEEDVFPSPRPAPSSSASSICPSLPPSPAHIQADDVRWSPSSHCGLSTPPSDPESSSHPLTRMASLSGMKSPSSSSVTPPTEDSSQVQLQRFREQESGALSSISSTRAEVKAEDAPPSQPLTSTPISKALSLGPALSIQTANLLPHKLEEDPGLAHVDFGPAHVDFGSTHVDFCPARAECGPAPLYEQLFQFALPRAATLFVATKTKEALERSGQHEQEESVSISPLKVLDQLIVHGYDAHQHLNWRSSAGSRSVDWSLSGGKPQSMKSKGHAPQGEELQALHSQLLLLHAQLQYERFKRQQHAVRNRRLLRRVVNTTVTEEHGVAMRAQLAVQQQELRCLKDSLQEEQRRFRELQTDSSAHTHTLHTHTQRLLLQLQEQQREGLRLQNELQECQTRMRHLEAELQKASSKASNANHQLTQLSAKLSSSEQLQQQIFLMNQQLVVLRETNRVLNQQLDAVQTHSWTEASMLQCSVGQEFRRLQDSELQQHQKLEAANQRTAELENQLVKKDQLIQVQKKLLEDTKAQSRFELSSSESRCVSLRRLCQKLQSEMLQLYSQIQPDTDTNTPIHTLTHTHSRPQDVGRPNELSKLRPLSSSPMGVANGTMEAHPASPIESPLAVGSFLEQHARQLFGPANQRQEEEEPQNSMEEEEGEDEAESPPLGQEVEEATPLTGSPPVESPTRAGPPGSSSSSSSTATTDLTLAVRRRRHELSIMDYDKTLPEF